jgi:hypothetical protein
MIAGVLHPTVLLIIHFFKILFLGAAQGADPVIGQLLKGGSNGDVPLRVAFGRVIDISTGAFISMHTFLSDF